MLKPWKVQVPADPSPARPIQEYQYLLSPPQPLCFGISIPFPFS